MKNKKIQILLIMSIERDYRVTEILAVNSHVPANADRKGRNKRTQLPQLVMVSTSIQIIAVTVIKNAQKFCNPMISSRFLTTLCTFSRVIVYIMQAMEASKPQIEVRGM